MSCWWKIFHRLVMLDYKTDLQFIFNKTPVNPSSSCSWKTHLYAVSLEPRWVLTRCWSSYLALCLSSFLFESKIPAPPIRNKQLASCIYLTFPWYPLDETDSMLSTKAREFFCTLSKSLANDIDKIPALQPIPERWKFLTLLFSPNLLITIAATDGVGQETLQLVIRMSMLFGFILCLEKRSCTIENSTVFSSSMLEFSEPSAGSKWVPQGKQVSLPTPDLSRTLVWNSTAFAVESSWSFCMFNESGYWSS